MSIGPQGEMVSTINDRINAARRREDASLAEELLDAVAEGGLVALVDRYHDLKPVLDAELAAEIHSILNGEDDDSTGVNQILVERLAAEADKSPWENTDWPEGWKVWESRTFNTDQPRDPDGKFASGGDTSEPSHDVNAKTKNGPDGTVGHFSPENGGLLFHGTGYPGAKLTGKETYMAEHYGETHAFAKGEVPGAGGGPKPSVLTIACAPGKTIDVSEEINEAIMEGGEEDIQKVFDSARDQGAHYVQFWHPSTVTDSEFKVTVALHPAEDLKKTGGWRLN